MLRQDRVEEVSPSRVLAVLERLVHGVTVDEVATVVLALWLLAGALAAARELARSSAARRGLGRALAACGVVLLLGIGHAALLVDEQLSSTGIVLAPEVDVRSGPGGDYVTEFELHAGTRVQVQRRTGGWVQVVLSEELRGWCPEEAVEEI